MSGDGEAAVLRVASIADSLSKAVSFLESLKRVGSLDFVGDQIDVLQEIFFGLEVSALCSGALWLRQDGLPRQVHLLRAS